jgi:shikimate kinase
MRSTFLVGFMGAGKTSVGEVLAGRLGFDFIDLDRRLCERFETSIQGIFARHGEEVFRTAERDELARCADEPEVVVATGGGAFCSEANREIIHVSGGLSVFLDLPWEALGARLAGDHAGRPKYGDVEQARRLFDSRLPDYRRATIIVELAGAESAESAADQVLAALEEAPCVT